MRLLLELQVPTQTCFDANLELAHRPGIVVGVGLEPQHRFRPKVLRICWSPWAVENRLTQI